MTASYPTDIPRDFNAEGCAPKQLRQAGFTTIELFVVMALSAIMAVVGVAHMPSLSQPFERMKARSLLIQDLKRAQAEAVTWGCRGVLEVDVDQGGYSYGCDFLPLDTNIPPRADQVFFERSLPRDIMISVSSSIIFSARGQATDYAGDINNVTINLTDISNGSAEVFASGILLGTGAFAYN